jgi:ribosomal protein L31
LSSERSGNHEAENPPGLPSGRFPRPRGEPRLPHQVDCDSERTITWEDGRTYPVVDVEISSASHPFYTGQSRVLDSAGRVEQFRRRYGNSAKGA